MLNTPDAALEAADAGNLGWLGRNGRKPRRASRLELDTSTFVVSLTLTTGGDLKRQQEVDMCDNQIAQL